MNGQAKTPLQASSGKQTVAILVLLIIAGVLMYMAFIFFAKFQTYKKIAESLKTEIQSNYNHYLQLNYNTVNNVIHLSNYNYEQSIKTLAGVFAKLDCNANDNCLINGISYQFMTAKRNNTLVITGYQANLSIDEAKAAHNSFVIAQTYSQRF